MKNNASVKKLAGFFDYEINRYRAMDPFDIPAVLYRLRRNEVTQLQLITLISIRYQFAHFFEDMLRHMIAVVDTGLFHRNEDPLTSKEKTSLREAATQNLQEELGELESYGGPHREGREVLLSALGVDYQKWKSNLGTYDNPGEVHESVLMLLTELKRIISTGAVEAISCLWYYENKISLDGVEGDYCILLKAFEQRFPEFKKDDYKEGDVLWHISSHAEHDVYHAALAEKALQSGHQSYVWVEAVDYGVRETRMALEYFWDRMSRFLGFAKSFELEPECV